MKQSVQNTATKAAYTNDIPNSPIRFLWYVTKPYAIWMVLAVTGVIIASTASQSTNYFFKLIVDAVERGDKDAALLFGLLYPVSIFLVQLMYRFSGWMGGYWTAHVKKKTYDDLVSYTLGHSHAYYSDRFGGALLSKVTNVVSAMGDFIADFLWTHLSALVSFIVSFAFIFSIDHWSGVIFLMLIAVLIVVNQWWAPKKRDLSRTAALTTTTLRGAIVDIFTNISAVRQYARSNAEQKGVEALSTTFRNAQQQNWMYSEKLMLVNSAILFVFGFSMFYLLVGRWSEGTITAGDFIFVLALVSQITGTLVFIGRAINNTARVIGEAEEGLDDLILPYEITDSAYAKKLKVSKGEVIWKDVNFEFGENAVFKNFNLTIPPGQRLGLVGPSGAGKTTFVSLLLRQHDIERGEILIDDQNIAEVTQDSLRENVAVVPQEPMLFHRSIRENIAYGNPKATKKQIEEVAKKAEAHKFIASLKSGYDTLVGERGVKLSGGQKQRVAIARAMLKNAPILILDEATSALDSESEVAIQKALHTLMEGKTVVAIAHRLSTLREMDRIIVLERGRVVEDGTHEELVKGGGTYARLWAHQAGGFLQD